MSEVNISGDYAYRSLVNDKGIQTEFNDLEFGRGIMSIAQKDGIIQGSFKMGEGYELEMEGTVNSSGTHSYLKMTGYGVSGSATDKWVYDYFGIIIPILPNAVAQIPTITGSVIRTVDHGLSKAGVTATFYMVVIM